jgi:hypothetical protein
MAVVRFSDIVAHLPCPVFGQYFDPMIGARVRDPESPGRDLCLSPSSLFTSTCLVFGQWIWISCSARAFRIRRVPAETSRGV